MTLMDEYPLEIQQFLTDYFGNVVSSQVHSFTLEFIHKRDADKTFEERVERHEALYNNLSEQTCAERWIVALLFDQELYWGVMNPFQRAITPSFACIMIRSGWSV